MIKYEEKHILSCYETDGAYRLRPFAFMNLAQEAAGLSASSLGFGHEELIKTNTAWILSRVHVVFVDTPKWREEVTLSTWHKGQKGVFYLRDFILKDSDDKIRIKATSSWLILNLETRAIVRRPNFNDENGICPENAIETPADKVVMPEDKAPELVHEHLVSYSDMDINGHTNNAMYMQWAMDAIDYALVSTTPVKEFTINFNHETKFGDKVDLYRLMEEHDDGLHAFVEGKVGDISSFIVDIIFAQ